MSLDRFIDAQTRDFPRALAEIKAGRKCSHWMWYIFPQLAGLGSSVTTKFYAIKNLPEAEEYLNHTVLEKQLVEISTALLQLNDKTVLQIFGSPDDMKLRSCMTLFKAVKNSDTVFGQVLDKFFGGEEDERTMALLRKVV